MSGNKFYCLDFWIIDGCLNNVSPMVSLVLGLSSRSRIHNILRRKVKANSECAKYRHPLRKSIPRHSIRQPSAVFPRKNWVFLTECPAIPCLHSPHGSPSSWRCKKLIPDGIQPIKKLPMRVRQKVKKSLPLAPVNKNFNTSQP